MTILNQQRKNRWPKIIPKQHSVRGSCSRDVWRVERVNIAASSALTSAKLLIICTTVQLETCCWYRFNFNVVSIESVSVLHWCTRAFLFFSRQNTSSSVTVHQPPRPKKMLGAYIQFLHIINLFYITIYDKAACEQKPPIVNVGYNHTSHASSQCLTNWCVAT